ncbi:MAG: hypothetical protein HQ591_10575 [candidate division Zixibacteria bacterium]|nr:hypothetical protein [Candidatus Tariuqbacter arcticus]
MIKIVQKDIYAEEKFKLYSLRNHLLLNLIEYGAQDIKIFPEHFPLTILKSVNGLKHNLLPSIADSSYPNPQSLTFTITQSASSAV